MAGLDIPSILPVGAGVEKWDGVGCYGAWLVFLLLWPNVPMAPQCFIKEKEIKMREAKQANPLPVSKFATVALAFDSATAQSQEH